MNGSRDQAVALVTRIEELLGRLHALLDEPPSAGDLHPASSDVVDSTFWSEPPPPPSFADGRWLGRSIDDVFELELRIDLARARRLSGDMYRQSRAGRRWFASFATPPAAPLLPASASWGIMFTRASERQLAEPAGTGTVALSKEGEEASLATESDWTGPALATIVAAESLPGFPTGITVTFRLEWCGPALRSLRICRNVAAASADRGSSRSTKRPRLSAATILETAGLRVQEVAVESFENTSRPASQVELLAMGLDSAAACRAREHDADLIVVDMAGTARPRLQAVRFPRHAALPDPVLAVSGRGAGAKSKTKLHAELRGVGESLGLLRRDTGDAWSSHSVSPMGSPVSYHHGRAAYWSRFDGQFEADELAFLGHAPLPRLGDVGRKAAFGLPQSDAVPNPAPFGGAAYWEEWPGVPRSGPSPSAGRVELHVGGPASGRIIHLGQPLFLELRLSNLSEEVLSLDAAMLDLKAGQVNLFARRVGWSRTQLFERRFQPIVRRAYDAPRNPVNVRGGETSGAVNMQVGYGTDGPFFPEPGIYDIHATVDLIDTDGVDRVSSAPFRIRVEEPHGSEATEETLRLLEPDAGFWLALGGFETLAATSATLLGIAEQRAGRAQGDGIVAAIRRAAAIDAGRFYSTRSASAAEAGLERCVELFDLLARDGGLINFDTATSTDTEQLWHKQARRLAGRRREEGAARLSKRKSSRRSSRAPSSR